MVINNQFKFLFIHVPKSAGTSITAALGRVTRYDDLEIGGTAFGEAIHQAYHERFGLEKHSTAAEVQSIIGAAAWQIYFTFAFVRNPFMRACSAFEYARNPNRAWLEHESSLRDAVQRCQSFAEFACSGLWDETDGPGRIFMPQTAWTHVASPESTVQAVDFIGSVENLSDDLQRCAAITCATEIGPSHGPVPFLNRGSRHLLAEQLTRKSVAAVLRKYAADFATFGYKEDPGAVMEPPCPSETWPPTSRPAVRRPNAAPAHQTPGREPTPDTSDEPHYEQLDLSAPMRGTGWYEPERDGPITWRWTGPTRFFTLALPLDPDSDYALVLHFNSPEPLCQSEFTAQLNQIPLTIELEGEAQGQLWSYVARTRLARTDLARSPALARLKFDTTRTRQLSLNDDRLLGVVVRRIAWRRL